MKFVFLAKSCVNIVFNCLFGVTIVPWEEFENKTYSNFGGEDKLHHGERESHRLSVFVNLMDFFLRTIHGGVTKFSVMYLSDTIFPNF